MKKQTEETILKQQIKDWLKWNNWFYFSVLQGLGCYPGICDIIACKNSIVLFIEIKSKKGYQSEKQKKFQANIESQKCHYLLIQSIEDLEFNIELMKVKL